MEASVQNVEDGTAKAREAGEALNRIVGGAADVNGEIELISKEAKGMQDSAAALSAVMTDVDRVAEESTTLAGEVTSGTQRAADSINSVSAVAEEAASSTQEVSASVEEVTAQIGELAVQARLLADISKEMTQFPGKFGAMASDLNLALDEDDGKARAA